MITMREKLMLLSVIENIKVATPCSDCINFTEGFCRKYESRIPEEHLSSGCDLWEYNKESIPF